MAVLLNTSLGDIVIDLHTDHCPLTCKNFLKLCRIKYYNNCVFHTVQKDFIVQTGDPSGTGSGGDSIYKFLYGDQARFFNDEIHSELKHDKVGTVAMASAGENLNASQFYITTRGDLDYLDGKHTVFGEVTEGMDTLTRINEAFVDEKGRPFKNIRIKHTYVLDDPFDDPVQLSELIPEKSPELKPPAEGEEVRLEDDWVPMDVLLDQEELEKSIRSKEAHSRAVVLEMVGDIPEAEIKPPENVLFVCKLNPVTQEEDLEIIFSRFGKIISADIIKDYKTGDSLCYAFIEFETQEACEAAYFKMDNVLIDDRRIHVDFSQSVARLWMRYRRFGKKDNADGEGTSFAPRSKGQGCFNCGEHGHLAKDCPNQALKETMQNLEKPKYTLRDTEGQHGGTNKRYEMLFEDTSGGVHKHMLHKGKDARRHDHEHGSSEEETADRSGSLPSKRSRDDRNASREHHNSGYRIKEAQSQNQLMDEKVKERAREDKHILAINPDGSYAQSKNRVDYGNRIGRKDRHKHDDREARYAASGLEKKQREDEEDANRIIKHTGMQKRHREDEQEDVKSHRHREGETVSRNSQGEYRHDNRREGREERKSKSKESRYAYEKDNIRREERDERKSRSKESEERNPRSKESRYAYEKDNIRREEREERKSRSKEREERKPRSKESKYAYEKHTRDADRLMESRKERR